jgi:hypothetical protein
MGKKLVTGFEAAVLMVSSFGLGFGIKEAWDSVYIQIRPSAIVKESVIVGATTEQKIKDSLVQQADVFAENQMREKKQLCETDKNAQSIINVDCLRLGSDFEP